jgi:catechol 2,3-dioxygenase-like lactoylglutathione lyase family enzyme
MKRFHVHVSVNDLAQSVRFYSNLFGSEPTVKKPDYAKWMLDDPRVNFAISRRGAAAGVDHLGLQVDSAEDLAGLEAQLREADAALREEPGTTCCYAKSDKYWVTDPQGVAWETFHTLGSVPTFSAPEPAAAPAANACCAPKKTVGIPVVAAKSCC